MWTLNPPKGRGIKTLSGSAKEKARENFLESVPRDGVLARRGWKISEFVRPKIAIEKSALLEMVVPNVEEFYNLTDRYQGYSIKEGS